MQSLMSRAWVEIDLGALVRNAERIARAAGVPILPMVKADAYGLGAVRAAHALRPLRPWGFGVATVEEGEELRHAGIDERILVFSPLLAAQLDSARRANLEPVLGDRETIAGWVAAQQPWHLMIDTGMNRAGIAWREMHVVREYVATFPPASVCTHFHSAERANGSREEQERRFADAVAALPVPPALLHADNSAAVEHRAPSPYDIARPGIFLYGVGSGNGARIEPDPVIAVRGRVVEVRVVQEGDTVGYDGTWRAARPGRVATVSLGYADGLRRSLGNAGAALVQGKRVAIVGTVTMDMTMLDVTDERCAVGDVATFIGTDGSESITVSDVARMSGLSPYEILTGLRSRLPRVYRSAESP